MTLDFGKLASQGLFAVSFGGLGTGIVSSIFKTCFDHVKRDEFNDLKVKIAENMTTKEDFNRLEDKLEEKFNQLIQAFLSRK